MNRVVQSIVKVTLVYGEIFNVTIERAAWEARLRWRCPAKTENYRPDFSSERAPHNNKPATV
jgi:hypothetical protein